MLNLRYLNVLHVTGQHFIFFSLDECFVLPKEAQSGLQETPDKL